MARKLRGEYPGALYQVMSGGNRREVIFKDDEVRRLFVETMGKACVETGWPVHAYRLIPKADCLGEIVSPLQSEDLFSHPMGEGEEVAGVR